MKAKVIVVVKETIRDYVRTRTDKGRLVKVRHVTKRYRIPRRLIEAYGLKEAVMRHRCRMVEPETVEMAPWN